MKIKNSSRSYSNQPCRYFAIFVILCFLSNGRLYAQDSTATDHDTTYYESYPGDVILRTYGSVKYTTFQMKENDKDLRLRYLPNSNFSLGVGFTYRKLSINLAHGFNFLNHNEEKGKLKRWDLQTRIYGRKWAIDLLGQFYKGYYLYPKGKATADPDQYYKRQDLYIRLVGLSIYRIFNYDRFTFRSAFVQDEWQKKSAGSPLAGFEVYYGLFQGDSALVPAVLSANHGQRDIRKVGVVQFGPGAGYAYTLVLPFHFFVTGIVRANLNLGLVRQTGLEVTNHTGLNANISYRFSVGYTNGNWNVNFFRLNNNQSLKGDSDGNRYVLNTGIYRVIIAKRFQPGPRGKKLLRPLDRVLNEIKPS